MAKFFEAYAAHVEATGKVGDWLVPGASRARYHRLLAAYRILVPFGALIHIPLCLLIMALALAPETVAAVVVSLFLSTNVMLFLALHRRIEPSRRRYIKHFVFFRSPMGWLITGGFSVFFAYFWQTYLAVAAGM